MKKIIYVQAVVFLALSVSGVHARGTTPIRFISKHAQESFIRMSWNAHTVMDKFGHGYWGTAQNLLEGNQSSAEYVRDLVVENKDQYPDLYGKLEHFFEIMMFALGKIVYALELGDRHDKDILSSQLNSVQQAQNRLNEARGFVSAFARFVDGNTNIKAVIQPGFVRKMRNAVEDLSSMTDFIQKSFQESLAKFQ